MIALPAHFGPKVTDGLNPVPLSREIEIESQLRRRAAGYRGTRHRPRADSRRPPLSSMLTQRLQQVSGCLQICCVQALRELLEYRLQDRAGTFALSLGCPQCRQVDGSAQFPC
jgi:hypothetical protein